MKLSATMEKVMNALNKAGYYYKDITSTDTDAWGRKVLFEKFHAKEKAFRVGFESASILKDGTIGITGHTNTLKALEKRGLIEIIEIGDEYMDIVKVVGVEHEAPLKEAVKLRVTRSYEGKENKSEFVHIMDGGMSVEEVHNRLNNDGTTAKFEVEVIGMAGLDVWDGQ